MPLSPILSNFVLRHFDKAFTSAGLDMVRYADDLIVFASSQEDCEQIERFTKVQLGKLDLDISPAKTEIRSPEQPVEFLGMELGLRPGTKQYSLTISEGQMTKIKESFTELHDVEFAVKEKLNLPQLLNRLENMKSGYRAAYGIADNYSALVGSLDLWSSNCVTKIYGSMFGHDRISRLNAKQRHFLLLPPV